MRWPPSKERHKKTNIKKSTKGVFCSGVCYSANLREAENKTALAHTQKRLVLCFCTTFFFSNTGHNCPQLSPRFHLKISTTMQGVGFESWAEYKSQPALVFDSNICVYFVKKKKKSKIRTVLHSDELTECVQDGGEYYTVSSFISKRSDKRFFLNRTYNFVFFIDQLLSNSINYFIAFLFYRGGNSLGKKPLNSRLLVTVPCLNIHNPCTFLFLYTNQKMYWMYFSLSPYFCTKSCLSI